MLHRTRENEMTKQNFAIGQIVSIGFVKGLVVKAKVATPGDYRPDLYALYQPASNRWYSFVPHNGIVRCANFEEACAW